MPIFRYPLDFRLASPLRKEQVSIGTQNLGSHFLKMETIFNMGLDLHIGLEEKVHAMKSNPMFLMSLKP